MEPMRKARGVSIARLEVVAKAKRTRYAKQQKYSPREVLVVRECRNCAAIERMV